MHLASLIGSPAGAQFGDRALMVGGALLEGLQALTPDGSANLAFCGVGGVPAAALLAEFFIRVRRWRAGAPRPNLCLRKNCQSKNSSSLV